MKLYDYLTFMVMFMFITLVTVASAFAQTLPTDVMGDVEWATIIGALIANPKALSAAFIGALIVLVIVQTMKHPKLGSIYKFMNPKLQFAVVTLLGQVYGLVVTVFVLKNQELSGALVGIFSSGGAVAIFNAFKLAFEKKA